MAPSSKNVTVTAAVLLLLVVVAAGEMSLENLCWHLSGNYHGPCLRNEGCRQTCLAESSDNIGGACMGYDIKCNCFTNCLP
ncbi:hypothetical protein BS78_08G161600 [Paspalum vaginatum]|nr:hypothetical protein BS78_08G161600 [Paspalum vaginatum]